MAVRACARIVEEIRVSSGVEKNVTSDSRNRSDQYVQNIGPNRSTHGIIIRICVLGEQQALVTETYRSSSITWSRTSRPGRTTDGGNVARASSVMFSMSRNVGEVVFT